MLCALWFSLEAVFPCCDHDVAIIALMCDKERHRGSEGAGGLGAAQQPGASAAPARNLAACTQREYSRDLRYFLSYLEQREITLASFSQR